MNNLDPKTFLFELPIYTSIKITHENANIFNDLISFKGSIDYYNPSIGENTTYNVSVAYDTHAASYTVSGGIGSGLARCVRTLEQYRFYYHLDNRDDDTGIFMKIGQYPSIAYFHISQIKQYNKVLSKDKLKEFTRAIGLAANGVGIGSFVYLRRIFEGLIEEAHIKASSGENWDNEQYSKLKTADRIEILKNYLPEFLVENKGLYGILSKGIHSLEEDECLAYFETVKMGIELILDEKVEAFEKQKKLDDAKQKIAALQGKINQK